MMRNILVTGAAGFIGSHLSEALVRKGYQVTGLDNLSYGRIENLAPILAHPSFQFIQGDVRDVDLLRAGQAVPAAGAVQVHEFLVFLRRPADARLLLGREPRVA